MILVSNHTPHASYTPSLTQLSVLVGVTVATFLWYVSCIAYSHSFQAQPIHRFFSNRVLLSPPSHSTPADSSVEWSYALDVHINAFFPLYLTLYLAQLFLLPIILKDNWVCLWVGNTLYLAACVCFRAAVYYLLVPLKLTIYFFLLASRNMYMVSI